MPDHILITYASRSGSTAEVAADIGATLRADLGAGYEVDVRDVAQAGELSPYSAVVIGAPIRMDRLLPAAVQFVEQNRAALADKTAADFTLCVAMKDDQPDYRDHAAGFPPPLVQVKTPVSVGLFAGNVDPKRLEFPWSWIVRVFKGGMMAPGDFRQWDVIRAWARSLAPLLSGRQPVAVR